MNPLAQELNDAIRSGSPTAWALLSERGKALYFPRGILSQSAEASQRAHRFNATIGVATEDGAPMTLPSVLRHVRDISPADAVNYAPAPGRPDLREAWKRKLLDENPSLRDKTFGTPIVTHAITHGLSLVGDLFIDPGDRVVLPDKLWGNYRLTYEVRLGAKIDTFETYSDSGFAVGALRKALLDGPDKSVVLLNFPNNPTGYMPTRGEVEGMREALVAAAETGRRLLVVCDDAYFGLVFDADALDESAFGLFAGAHPNLMAVKLDGATKELFVWGLRCGFITFAPPVQGDTKPVLEALEKKTMGAIRGSISNCAQLSQSIVASALSSDSIEAERKQKLETLRARALKVREVVQLPEYADDWDVYPFNAGYFMCIRVRGVDAEQLRQHLLNEYGIGLISIGSTDLRVAFSCLEIDEIEPLFAAVHQAIGDLRGTGA